MRQLSLIPTRPMGQLLKWVGNKYKYAHIIVSYFPANYNKFIEPFVGTGAILATLSPKKAIAGDTLAPLIEIWTLLQNDPKKLIDYYASIITRFNCNRQETYEEVRQRYNSSPNGLDLLVLSRTCYGGVIRFTKEGKISTPVGPHKPISPNAFTSRVMEWRQRVENVTFLNRSFLDTMSLAEKGDLVYCDPPYVDSQAILYGAQSFSFAKLIEQIQRCKNIEAKVALSIDGKKKSERKTVQLQIPSGIFEREVYLDCGSAMLKRFQKRGEVMIGEDVHDRLLLTW
ncbi:MAG: Dam family site-specific DNA-(adenine-N6)-methyltransferase [candidate division Zixibacteria bacterium]|nr:Dam family site-specific DNA-(adenine-N6)-methyltransferase [candidate division Zixibacteria bacterium]